MRAIRCTPHAVDWTIVLLIALAAVVSAGAHATGADARASACSNESVTQPVGGRQTVRVVAIGKVSCDKAGHLVRAFFRRVASGHCDGNICANSFPGGWNCSYISAVEEREEISGAFVACLRARTGAKVRVYETEDTRRPDGALHLQSFLSPDRKIWCVIENLGSDHKAVCSSKSKPRRSATVHRDGQVELCTETTGKPHPVEDFICFENWDPRAPVLAYGRRNQASGFRCTPERNGMVCITFTSAGTRNGFRINLNEAVEQR